jgi:anti-sigma-K factor RskA
MATVRHNDMRDLLGVYALGLADAEEASALRAHLATCAECRAELGELRETVDALPLAAAPMDPPPTLRDRIDRAILAEPKPTSSPTPERPPLAVVPPPPQVVARPASFWASARPWAAAAALLLLVTAGLLVWNLRLQQQLDSLSTPVTIALAPTDAAPGASGEVRYDPNAQLFLVDVRDLPPLPEGDVYQLWLIDDAGPVPAGVFDQSTDEHAVVADRELYQAVAITAEPGPLGSPAPTGEILVQGTL